MKLSFVVCANDAQILSACLMNSPCIAPGLGHQLIVATGASSAADGFFWGRRFACHDWMVLVHQDVFLPEGWDEKFAAAVQSAREKDPSVAVVGVYGVTGDGRHVGHVKDRGKWIGGPLQEPVRVRSLDELLVAVRTDLPLAMDAELGFHLYATDLVLAAARIGCNSVVVDAPCEHHSNMSNDRISENLARAFTASAAVFEHKWRDDLPVTTPCVTLDGHGNVSRFIHSLKVN